MYPLLKVHYNKDTRKQLFKKRSILIFIFHALLIMFGNHSVYGQDTIRVNDDSMGDISKYGARDSMFADIKKQQLHLYGNAYVETEGVNLTAGYILVDLAKNELLATYAYDADSNRIESPVFKDGSDEIEAATIKYNLTTKKAYIEEVKIVQDEMFLYMEQAKRQSNEEIHFLQGRFTTCDLPDPHYHFQLSKAVLVPDKRIVTGPMNLWIAGVPTPFGLPFSYIPQQEDRTHGIIFPQIVPISEYGSGLNELGYYFPINDFVQTTAYVNAYTRGSWGIRNATNYSKRYKFAGNFDVGFEQFKRGFPDSSNINKFSVTWLHKKDAKSNPYWNFNSNVKFASNNDTKQNLNPNNTDYFKNTLLSDININRSFPGKPYRVGAKLSISQNSQTENIALTSPSVNFNTSQFFPLKKLFTGSQPWKQIFQRFGVIYSFEGQNRSTFKDTLLRDKNYDAIGQQFFNGAQQKITIQTTGGLFKNILKITPSINYGTKLNFQQIRKSYDTVLDATIIDTIQSAGLAHDLSFNMSATTVLYSYYRFAGKSKPLLRHVMTPNITFSYIPKLNELISDSVGVNMKPVQYSPFEQSIYSSQSIAKDQALISFGLNNSFELKRRSDKDTVTGFKKSRIIDALSFNGNYDIKKDSMKLSNINISLRISPIPWLNFVGTSLFSPYGWTDSTGATTKEYAVNSGRGLGRTLSNTFSTTLTLTSKSSREKIEENQQVAAANWNSDYDYFYLHPEYILDFEIPWKVSFSHNYNLTRNTRKAIDNQKEFIESHTLMTNGDLSFTKRWKVAGTINTDLKTLKVTNANFTLSRDMHCWALAFSWTPIGTNKSFLLTIRNTSSIFGDAKLDFRKPPAFF